MSNERPDTGLIETSHVVLEKRKLTEETCRMWDYGVATYSGQPVQVATYRDESGLPIAQKIRFPSKDFRLVGRTKDLPLYGQNLWRTSGKMVVVTEGEIDAMSLSQVQDHRWPVVSIPTGAAGAVGAIKKNLDWLEGYETVVLMFDMDDAGQKAARECALVLSPGKAKIARLDLKDPSEMLMAGRTKALVESIWNAKTFRPDGIVAGTDLWDAIVTPPEGSSIDYPWAGLNEKTLGLRSREIVTICSGSGIGKSSVCREIAHWLLALGETVGYIALEESTRRTATGIIGIAMNRPLHIEMSRPGCSVDPEEIRSAYDRTVGSGRLFMYDHFGSMNSDNLLSRIRYMVRGLGCRWIFLDHLSIVVSGLGDGDERRLIDNTMTALRSLVEELDCGMVLVSHLKRPEGRGHEEGAHTSLSHLRGSAAIGQLSDIVLGLERNQQDPESKDTMNLRVLKNRFTGETGEACRLTYSRDTGRLSESPLIVSGESDFSEDPDF